MPKASPFQPSFSAGEFSPKIYGRADTERYKTGLATCLNYLPTTQGPIVRRPGFKYSGADAKDPSKPPNFIEFKFSQTQNYILEFGDKYVRFFTPSGQITTSSTHFKVSGNVGALYTHFNSSHFYAMRTAPNSLPYETILASSVVSASSVLEIGSPYSYPDVFNLKTAQREDVLYITCSSYPEFKLQRFGNQEWTLRAVLNQDGPYLPFNSYRSIADNVGVTIVTELTTLVVDPDISTAYDGYTGPRKLISNAANNGAGLIRITSTSHGYTTGQKVVITGIAGTTEANNGTSSLFAMSWPIIKVDANNFDLVGSTFSNAYVGSGRVQPAMFEPISATEFADVGRVIGLVNSGGGRFWGRITQVLDPARFRYHIDSTTSGLWGGGGSTAAQFWQLGVWNRLNGYPNAVCFHQGRKFLAGTPAFPQEIDGSVVGEYDNFAASGSSYAVTDASAIQQTLDSDSLNAITWLKSDAHGLLAGSLSTEWNIAPSNQAGALTPTNFNAAATSFFGSHNANAVQTGNATLYIQGGQRRVRELNYFYQVDTYRSTDLAELSDHITNPGLVRLCVQKEPIPIVWANKSDGGLVSMVYNRDDATLKVGWARHTLGGRSDSANAAPLVKTAAVIPAADGTYDQLWVATQRYVNGTTVCNIEYMTKVFDDETNQEDAVYLDCAGTYDSPITISAISIGGSAIVTAAGHGLANGDYVKITEVVGLNSSVVDVDGYVYRSSLVNGHVFVAGSVATNAFFLKDFDGNYISSLGYSSYISGGEARKLVSTISGLTWLKNETVSILADGKIHPTAVVNSAGVLALEYSAAVVQIGYPYNSDGQQLRLEAGAADGTSIGKIRRSVRAAFMVNNVGELQIGTNFNRLTPLEFAQGMTADEATPLFSGIIREGVESEYSFESQVCWRQSAPLPGMVQSLTIMMEEQDV